ncbi:MAG: HEAT repeat domain-containing protein [Desulfobacterales bacterium]|nr:HEAT repeat domain-containing protein [Desulfobacterales bacterium]
MNLYLPIVIRALFALLSFETGAALFVGQSNTFLLEKSQAIVDSGVFAIPTDQTLPALDSLSAAIGGGLFFTLTSGALFLLLSLISWAILLFGATPNRARVAHGFFALGAIFLVTPSISTLPLLGGTLGLFAVMCPTSIKKEPRMSLRGWLFHTGVPLMLAALLFGTHLVLPRGIFSGFRDGFLFGNPAGSAIRKAYYTYTLFPAEAFKRLTQKSQLAVTPVTPLPKEVKKSLKRLGHIELAHGPSDYTLSLEGEDLLFKGDGKTWRVSTFKFIRSPRDHFKRFSEKADPFSSLRSITAFALPTAFPLLVYLSAHTLFTLGAALLFPQKKAALLATATMGILSALAIALLAGGKTIPFEVRHTLNALVKEKGKPGYTRIVSEAGQNPNPLIRYRAGQAAASIRNVKAQRKILTNLLNDSDINVVCQAMGAMGRTGDPHYTPTLLRHINATPTWYIQWYGYGALRRLGWHP